MARSSAIQQCPQLRLTHLQDLRAIRLQPLGAHAGEAGKVGQGRRVAFGDRGQRGVQKHDVGRHAVLPRHLGAPGLEVDEAHLGAGAQFGGRWLAHEARFVRLPRHAGSCPIGIGVSVLLTILAIIGIAEKDRPEYYGIGGSKQEKVKLSEYMEIIRNNKPMKRLMVAGAGCKLALAIATNTTVLLALYGILMGNYDSLYLPMMILGYVFAVPFFLLSVRTSQKKGQKASLQKYVGIALVCYIGVLALLIVSSVSNPNLLLSFPYNGGGAINLYTVLFILCFGIGYGAYYATADMPIPMVADCSDYETYRSGKYIPGIMGTLFSLVDKLVSSLAQTLVALIFLWCAGLSELPTDATPYSTGIKVAVIIMFCVIPMLAWAATLWAMKGYSLTGAKMKEIQAVNRARKAAVNDGMTLEQAMDTIKTTEDAEKYQTTGGKTAAM